MMKKLRKLSAWLIDPSTDLTERMFVALTIITTFGILAALVGDIVYGESLVEIVLLSVTVILVPVSTALCIKRRKISVEARIVVISLVFFILPVVFFFGGGLEGGCVHWILFSYLYIGLVLTGAWRTALLVLLTIFSLLAYLLEYYHPELIVPHARKMFFTDSFISLVVVGIVVYVMVWFLNRLYQEENRRARAETERAEELNRAQNRFFSSMSHEIRTPINSILGLNELILRQDGASDEILRDAANIQGAGKMLLSLINDILDFSKIEAGSMEIVPVEYRVGDLISEIVNMIWLRANEKGLKFTVDIDPQVPSVLFGDEVRIKQILINLLNNAVKYTQTGSVSLHIESEDAGENRVLLKISVSDTGMGIKKETIPYLFDAFRRMDQEKNRRIEGTGLGLSIVKQLVDLMGGTITVNSVYMQGSTFTVNLTQGVVAATAVGDISITNYGSGDIRQKHLSRFSAPEARVLIVDDNEMNLEVERKLLAGTDMLVDTAPGGAEALELAQRFHYDVILMDHLMPGMDGIECLKELRLQVGGLNRRIPVIVLTANAGAEDRERYNAAGFDGCLVKPVSGRELEDMLLKHLPPKKLLRIESSSMTGEEMRTAKGYSRKQNVLITTNSMSDLPDSVIRQLGLDVIPCTVLTGVGTFRDGVEISADELMRYFNAGGSAASAPPEVADYVAFFGAMLKRAQHVIHIELFTGINRKYYDHAVEAARSFENVTVVDSEYITSGIGLLVLVACRLARQNQSVEAILAELEEAKRLIQCSFLIKTTHQMMLRGHISRRVHSAINALELHPCLRISENRLSISAMWMGNMRRCCDKYIRSALRRVTPDHDVLFVTYVDLSEEELAWIESRIRKLAHFERIIFQPASAAVSANCGPGAFGVLFMEKGQRSYNLAALLPEEQTADETPERAARSPRRTASVIEVAPPDAPPPEYEPEPEPEAPTGEDKWLADVPGLDYAEGVRACGGAESFRKALELFYRSAGAKADELEGYWRGEDIHNYTIKVHALKSSARLIGARELAERAQSLEAAGKAGDTAQLDEGTAPLLALLRSFADALRPLDGGGAEDARASVDAAVLQRVYAALAGAAGAMDYDAAEALLDSLKAYRLPPEDAQRAEDLRNALLELDWERFAALADVERSKEK